MSTKSEVILGVGGGIAAYKSCDLLRRLQELGYVVTVVPTPAALNFVGKATWEALSGRPVHSELWENVGTVPHVALADTGAPILVAPATADLLARITHGRADDLLTTTILATRAPIFCAPAMHPQMWENAATMANVATLRSRGIHILDPDSGRLTGKDSGVGRLPETKTIIDAFESFLGASKDYAGKHVLVTAGGTREPIDPVRFIGNRSSGKQGYAIAKVAAARGATVDLVLANAQFPSFPGVRQHQVESVSHLQDLLQRLAPAADYIFMTAAVSDAKPSAVSTSKIHKDELSSITLTPNPDLLASIVTNKPEGQIIVGFAAETEDLIASARAKMERKGVDAIYVNDVSGGAIFGSPRTYGTILLRDGAQISVGESSKEELATKLLDAVRER